MKHFNNITSFADLKKQYRTLAIANHPDKGGSTEIMQEINAEFEKLYKIWEHRKDSGSRITGYENDYSGATAKEYADYVYREYRFVGSNYKGQSPREVCEILRKWLKETYPHYKFSVRNRHYSSICINLIMADFEVFTEKAINKKFADINTYHIDKDDELTDRAKEVMKNVKDFVSSYNFDDSDSMTDYFHVNFYLDMGIGDSTHPYKIEIPKLRHKGKKTEPIFKRPEGKVHKAIRQALGKAAFSEYATRSKGKIIVLGEHGFLHDGGDRFYPLCYSSERTARKRMDKLIAAGILCRTTGYNGGYIEFLGYTPETEQALKEEDIAADLAEQEWNSKQQNLKQAS